MNLSQILVENAFAVLLSVLVAFGGAMWKLNGQVASLGTQISGFKETVEKDVARLDGNIIRIEADIGRLDVRMQRLESQMVGIAVGLARIEGRVEPASVTGSVSP